MSMKILVIGGSYFFGRWFVQHAYKEHEVTVLNRGSITIGLSGVTEIRADRHNSDELCKLEIDGIGYDAVVDFCAYDEGDISGILSWLKGAPPEKYIFISTVDVYKKGTGKALDESAEMSDNRDICDETEASDSTDAPGNSDTTDTSGGVDAYIKGKVKLEHELVAECKKYGIKGVSVRPVILYGPGNYAPRESVYFEWINKAGQIIHPVDSDGFFQMLYVSDAARGILKLCEMPGELLHDAYNFCSDEVLTYDSYEGALEKAYLKRDPSIKGGAFSKIDVPVETVLKQGIPLPFPLLKEESEVYSGALFGGLGIDITPLSEGLYNCLKLEAGNV